MVGTFDEEFLKVPEEIIVDAMLMHQRYFPLYDEDGQARPTSSSSSPTATRPTPDTIVGRQRARGAPPASSDAKFFYDEDLKHAAGVPTSTASTRWCFQEALGTMQRQDRPRREAARPQHLAGRRAAEARRDARTIARSRHDLAEGRPGDERRRRVHAASRASWAPTTPPPAGEGASAWLAPSPTTTARALRRRAIPRRIVGQVVAHLRQARHHLRPVRRGPERPPAPPTPSRLRRSRHRASLAILEETGLPCQPGGRPSTRSLITYREAGLQFDNAEVRRRDHRLLRRRATKVACCAMPARCAPTPCDDAVLAHAASKEPDRDSLAAHRAAGGRPRRRTRQVFDDLATAYARAEQPA
ncbi:MAG: glycine--tRNA ligase subunit beta [Adlercreutzia equolifaciens]